MSCFWSCNWEIIDISHMKGIKSGEEYIVVTSKCKDCGDIKQEDLESHIPKDKLMKAKEKE